MFRLICLFFAFFFSPVASAWVMPLDPQNRVHAGLSLADYSLQKGFVVGLDSRMTRLIYVDVGGFGTLTDSPEVDLDETDPFGLISLRHGLTVTPGIRIPHRYGEGFNWDLTLRAGFGAIWVSDASSEYSNQVDPALLSGFDLLLRQGAVGLRIGSRVFGFKPFTKQTRDEVPMVRPQQSVELVYQW